MVNSSGDSLYQAVTELLKKGLPEEQFREALRYLVDVSGGVVKDIKPLINGHGIGKQKGSSILGPFHLPNDKK